MLLLLSPAKSLDYETPVPAGLPATEPPFPARSAALIKVLRRLTPAQVGSLMSISDTLAQRNVERFRAWSATPSETQARQAVLAFDGDVYGGLDARSLTCDDLLWAQDHLGILSGLYGLLRPLDRLQPYRLEMGTRLATPRGPDLYRFWGDDIAQLLNARLRADRTPVVVNLASQEYSKAVDRTVLKARLVDCVFEERKPAGYQIVSFHAKRARGLMARYAVQHRAALPQQLQGFDAEGYRFAPEVSAPDRLVFRRDGAGAPAHPAGSVTS